MLAEVAGHLPDGLPAAIDAYLAAQLDGGGRPCALLEDGGVPVGSAMRCLYTVMPDEINLRGTCATLFSVHTRPAYRGQGYMQQLLGLLLERARAAGVAEIFAAAAPKAVPLYTRLGFEAMEHGLRLRLG